MKKIMLVILIMSLWLGIGNSEGTDEILFRGIPWLTDAVSFGNTISADIGYEKDISYITDYDISLWDDKYEETKNSGVSFTMWCSDYDIQVAGHKLRNINVYAIYGIEDNEISKDINLTRVCKASYVLDGDNVQFVYEDVYAKLCDLYGEPYIKPTMFSDAVEWRGDNNTAVRLEKLDGLFSGVVRIDYGLINIDTMLRDLVNIRNKVSQTDDSGL